MITYSKPSNDVQIEAKTIAGNDRALLDEQIRFALELKKFKDRQACLLCHTPLKDAKVFVHRSIDYKSCNTCGHIQSKAYVPNHFPASAKPEQLDYSKIYSQDDKDSYLSRVRRVYEPKRAWIYQNLEPIITNLNQKKWVEIGCGAGYFLKSLKDHGAERVQGFEQNETLVSQSKLFLEDVEQVVFDSSKLQTIDADIVVAFFVLEHLSDAHIFWQSIKSFKPGTVFVFSVPMFSMSTLLESAIDSYAARNLDNGLHTQLYTDESIDYALSLAEYKKIATWYFGQDAMDLVRLLIGKLEAKYDPKLLEQHQKSLTSMIDSIQQVIDKHQFCDARHIICVKE